MSLESDLYAPVKALLEGQGYSVKGEIRGCDVVGVRGSEQPVIVELKRVFGLGLVLQGVNRLALSDTVYLAVGAWPKNMRDVKKLCRRLGLGLMIVTGERVDLLLDPAPYAPRKNKRKVGRLLGEHKRRVGDPTRGGSTTRAPRMTAYRQAALRCAALLARNGPMKVSAVRDAGEASNAGAILRDDVYGWFERVDRGIYRADRVEGSGDDRESAQDDGQGRLASPLSRRAEGGGRLPAPPFLLGRAQPRRSRATRAIGRKPRSMYGIACNTLDEQVALLKSWIAPHADYLQEHSVHREAFVGGGGDGGYGEIEADMLFGFIATCRPKRVIQVGCGVSTAIILAAAGTSGYTPGGRLHRALSQRVSHGGGEERTDPARVQAGAARRS